MNNSHAQQSEANGNDEIKNLQNKLLEEIDGQRLDTGKTCTSGQVDQKVASLREVYRTKKRNR